MTESFTPLLTTTDRNAEWMQLQKARRHRDSAVYWNERAKTFTSKDYPNPYVNSFLERAGIAPEAAGRALSPCRSGKRGMLSRPPTSRKGCFPSFTGNLRHVRSKTCIASR